MNVSPNAADPVETVFDGRWMRVYRKGDWYWAANAERGGAAILPIDPTGAILAVAIHRPAIGGVSVEIPRGGRDDGESLARCAARELEEETGLHVAEDRLVPLGSIFPDGGVVSTHLHLFAAPVDTCFESGGFATEEILGLRVIPRDQLDAWLLGSEVDAPGAGAGAIDGITLATVLRARLLGLI